MANQLTITSDQGIEIALSVFEAEGGKDFVAICLPAMGVRASYYEPFAKALAQAGIHTVTADWRGHGASTIRADRKINFGYIDLLQDVGEIVAMVQSWYPTAKRLIIGHSLGGQVGSLYMSQFPGHISGIVLIASCSVYHRGWQGLANLRVRLAGYLFYPISLVVGYFPGKTIGFGGREARNVMKDWSSTIRSGLYEPSGSNFDYESAMAQLQTSVLAISIQGDSLAPKQAVQNLLNKFHPETSILHDHVDGHTPTGAKLTHFNWARDGVFIPRILSWIKH